jgi:hypothetical protein
MSGIRNEYLHMNGTCLLGGSHSIPFIRTAAGGCFANPNSQTVQKDRSVDVCNE